ALHFSIPAKILGDVFFFFPNDYAYEIILTIGQYILLAITTIMLGRMLKLSEDDKKYFYLLISCSFPYILFSFLLEQYVIALFYLILTFYYHWSKPEKTNYLYIGAVGTLITSGIVFPVITKFKNLKNWITSVFKCFLAFVAVLIVAGQLPQIFELVDKFNSLFGDFSHSSTLSDKLYQFTHFIKGIFLANPGHYETIFFHPSYQLIHFTNVSLVGIGLFILCIVGFILNKNNKMALISLLWIGFSILILFVLGWGTAENGLVLYSLYFAWAYLILYFLFFKTIFKKKIIFKICIIVSCAIMLIFNINEFLKILKFALIYY
ncbi:MAG: hypothetical protein IJ093_00665, partial [Bacilli bacterium]|nr:hypothetical protein [Bacilli bacterium]